MQDDLPLSIESGFPADLQGPLLAEMADAAEVYLSCRKRLTAVGRTIAEEIAGDTLQAFTHYPRGDVYDPESHAQYYFHLHRLSDHGHFHTFLRGAGMPAGVRPAVDSSARCDSEALCHLIAIGLDHRGEPGSLFTTNRWVTAETWYGADDVISMLPRFRIGHGEPTATANRWMQAVVTLFRPQIAGLLRARDACIVRHAAVSGGSVLEDRALDVTSCLAVDIDGHIRQVLAIAARQKETPPGGAAFQIGGR